MNAVEIERRGEPSYKMRIRYSTRSTRQHAALRAVSLLSRGAVELEAT
jgi:hypothetical protein